MHYILIVDLSFLNAKKSWKMKPNVSRFKVCIHIPNMSLSKRWDRTFNFLSKSIRKSFERCHLFLVVFLIRIKSVPLPFHIPWQLARLPLSGVDLSASMAIKWCAKAINICASNGTYDHGCNSATPYEPSDSVWAIIGNMTQIRTHRIFTNPCILHLWAYFSFMV